MTIGRYVIYHIQQLFNSNMLYTLNNPALMSAPVGPESFQYTHFCIRSQTLILVKLSTMLEHLVTNCSSDPTGYVMAHIAKSNIFAS